MNKDIDNWTQKDQKEFTKAVLLVFSMVNLWRSTSRYKRWCIVMWLIFGPVEPEESKL